MFEKHATVTPRLNKVNNHLVDIMFYIPIILGGPDFHILVAGNEDIVDADDEAPMAP